MENLDDVILSESKNFKVEERKKWNLVLVLHPGNLSDENIRIDLQEYYFIKEVEILPFTSNPLLTKTINALVLIKGFVLKSIFGTKLTKLSAKVEKNFAGKISRICKNPQDKKPFVMINLNKNNPKNSFNEEYGTKVFENLFPLVNSKIYAFGTPENSKEWNKIALVRYQSHKHFCEMVFSGEYQELA